MIVESLSKKFILVCSFLLAMPVAFLYTGTSTENFSKNNSETLVAVNGGTVTGVVRFPEEYPEREKIIITKDHQVCGAFQYSETFVVSEENRGLKNVVISLLNVKKGEKIAGNSKATLDQRGCHYIPHVQAVPVSTELEILNSDGILHNVHAYLNGLDPDKTVFNKAQPKFLKKIKQTLDKTGIYYFKCDVHDHMSAFIAVFDHPYYSVTDDNGQFSITNVPPGIYKIQAWHEALGTLEKEVTVAAGKSAEVKFEILPNE